ncbi:MAG: glucosaminidase domain-containing protein [Thomasclavelia sp.]|jgi:uncharacterized protein YjdB|nr:glucosaminidase domain-containing protein [Thomasclavelia sp.]
MKKIISLIITLVMCCSFINPTYASTSITYSGHQQNVGNLNAVSDGTTLGKTGKSLRLEAIKINNTTGISGKIRYRVHIQNKGTQEYKENGELAGTTGKGLRLEALQIYLTGNLGSTYDVYYRTHIQNYGWLNWTRGKDDNLSWSGSIGQSLRVEAVQITLVKRGTKPVSSSPISSTNQTLVAKQVVYSGHQQNVGNVSNVYDGSACGTTGKSLRLEGIRVNKSTKLTGVDGNINYRGHVQSVGNQAYVKNGELAGTTGKGLRLEAIQMYLSGELANEFDIYYRTHVSGYGWLAWVKGSNDDSSWSGSKGLSQQIESYEVEVVTKGSTPLSTIPTNNSNYGFIDKNNIGSISFSGRQTNIIGADSSGIIGDKTSNMQGLIAYKTQGAINGTVQTEAHVSSKGWLGYKNAGTFSGDTSNTLQAFRIQLTGDLAKVKDVYYRAYNSKYGWMQWTKNGEAAGSTGYSENLKAIQVVMVNKGVSQPTNDSNTSIAFEAAPSYVGKVMIMHSPTTTVEKMVKQFNSKGKQYPSALASKGASNIQTFAQICYDEASKEGVDPAVLFAQIMEETGYLQYGGDVKVTQCNFGGLGATGGGNPGLTFSNVRTGIRAQVQHLQAYATVNTKLKQTCVDPRYNYVKRGSAPCVEWLGIPDNPYGGGWAAGKNYGAKIINIMNEMSTR